MLRFPIHMATKGPTPVLLSPEVVDFLEGGRITFVATRDPEMVPECVLASGVRISADRRIASVFVPEVFAELTQRNLAHNRQVAVTTTHVVDSRSVQLKGEMTEVGRATEDDLRFLEGPIQGLRHELALAGMPRSFTARLVHFPSIAIRLRVREVYDQTPGPRAGKPLESGRVERATGSMTRGGNR